MNRLASVQLVCAGFILILITSAIACLPSVKMPPPAPSAPVVAPSAPVAPVQDVPVSPTLEQTQKVIFRDDFKYSRSGWTIFSNDFGEGKYESGSYLLSCTQPSYHGAQASATTTNAGLTSLTGFMLDMDVTMLSGSKNDFYGIVLKWPDINPLGIVGYEQPSDYYFCIAPEGMLAWCYSKQEVKSLSVDKIPGYFLRPSQYACVRGINKINNVKIWFNPDIRFMINDHELFTATDQNLDYVNRLIKDKAMPGATLIIAANSQDTYSRPVFQLNRIAVYPNN